MDLMEIQPAVQRIADAIAAVLKIEVEIANKHFIRVAGTGEQKSSVLHKMEGDLVYQSALRTGGPVIIENPGYEEVCERCKFYQNCSETGEICTPITYKGQPIGVIGLLAFNEEQRRRLFENKEDILSFLYKMAELLSSKLHEHEMVEQLTRSSEKMARLINLVNEGIVVLDGNGIIQETNVKARILLEIEEEACELPPNVRSLFKEIVQDTAVEHQPFTVEINGRSKSFFIVKQKLSSIGRYTEFLLILQDIHEIQYLAEKVTKNQKRAFDKIVGTSAQIKEVKEYAYNVSQSPSTILIQGESGTGKEEFAKAIHFSSKRKDQPLVTVNCGAIPEHLLESELFGYDAGAFTGATKKGKPGKFELANKGTIFLDEIGEMPALLQVKLLRVLQQREVERVGGVTPIPVDVRVITATNRDLQEMVMQGTFREDLYYRLNVIPMILPPLRGRKEDIIALSEHFISSFNKEFNSNILGLGKDVKELMINYSWKGNVRELKNFIEYLFNFLSTGWITMDRAEALISKKLKLQKGDFDKKEISFSLEEMEKEMIIKAVTHVKSQSLNIEDASRLLGIGRATLFRKMNKYQIKT
ncbi:Transcriptional regulatory protein ZraR [Bacillus sp. THAF10]|nr:Transcriptional regulatory protein ZraR [Bacillus sp. THAF10]